MCCAIKYHSRAVCYIPLSITDISAIKVMFKILSNPKDTYLNWLRIKSWPKEKLSHFGLHWFKNFFKVRCNTQIQRFLNIPQYLKSKYNLDIDITTCNFVVGFETHINPVVQFSHKGEQYCWRDIRGISIFCVDLNPFITNLCSEGVQVALWWGSTDSWVVNKLHYIVINQTNLFSC